MSYIGIQASELWEGASSRGPPGTGRIHTHHRVVLSHIGLSPDDSSAKSNTVKKASLTRGKHVFQDKTYYYKIWYCWWVSQNLLETMYYEPNKENDEKVMSKPENLKVWSPVKKKNHFNKFSYVASKKI